MRVARPSTRAVVAALAGMALFAAATWPALGTGATSGTVVGATVPSAISMQDQCRQTAAHDFGTVLPGSPVTTATGAGVCRFSFTSSNSSSMLRLYQSDRNTQAMVGTSPGWNWQSVGGSDNDLAHAGTGLMLMQDTWSASGTYRRSTDGGANWTTFNPGGGVTPQVAVASTTVAWRFGDGNVRRSTDMQATTPSWTSINSSVQGGGSVQVLGADAIDANVAWISHFAGVYRTGDAGATPWSISFTGCTNPFVIDAVSSSTAFVVGWGDICRTTTSNASWQNLRPSMPAGFGASDVEASPQTLTTIWATSGEGRVARSTNNGNTWTVLPALPIPVELTSIDVRADDEAWVAGADGLVFYTANAGATWTRIRVPVTGRVTGVMAPAVSNFVVATKAARPVATTTGGTTWIYPDGIVDAYRDIDSVDGKTLVMPIGGGRVAYSTNGGASHTNVSVGVGNTNMRGVAVLDSDSWIAVGDQGTIVVTEDGGATWSTRPSGTSQDLWDVTVTSEHVAIAVGASGTILRSTDGGWNWTTRSAAGADLHYVDAKSGTPAIAVGVAGAIRRSIDGGLTWTTPTSGVTSNLESISVPSDDVAYAAAWGTMLKSTDGGATWTTKSIGGMTRISAVTEDVIWLTSALSPGWGQWANLSYDGGATFISPWANDDPDVTAMRALDTGKVFFVGSGESLRSTTPASTIPDYAGGGWTAGTSLFGACLQDLSGSAGLASWAEDASGTCTAANSDNWYAVPTAPVKVAQIATAGTGVVDLVWGFRPAANLPRGTFTAGITVEAIAPNA